MAGTEQAQRPNIVWIQADDLGADLGCMGTVGVETPNIDRLAEAGMLFNRYYATAPTCAPARTAMLTGHYTTALNAQHHHSHPEFPPHVKHLAERLREGAGYFPANVARNKPGLPDLGWGKLDYCWSRDTTDEFYESDDYNDLAANQPFYAEFQTIEPHLPWHSLEKYAEVGLAVDPDEVEPPPYYPNTPESRVVWAKYLSDVQVFDAKVGHIVGMLEEDGLLDDTIVMVVSDHGRDMLRAKFTLYEGGIHVPLVISIPSKYRPEGYEPGTVSDQLVSGVDLMPTILSIVGLEIPPELPGQPFLGPERAEREYAFANRDRVASHVDRSRAVVSKRYHYVRNFMPNQPGFWPPSLVNGFDLAYDEMVEIMLDMRAEGTLNTAQESVLAEVRPPEELFDLENDPHTLHNLADDEQHLDALRRMRTELRRWIAETDDKGFISEDPAEAQKGAWVVPLWLKLTKGQYDVDKYDVYALPVDDEFRDMLK